jgi:hypothetical protein
MRFKLILMGMAPRGCDPPLKVMRVYDAITDGKNLKKRT